MPQLTIFLSPLNLVNLAPYNTAATKSKKIDLLSMSVRKRKINCDSEKNPLTNQHFLKLFNDDISNGLLKFWKNMDSRKQFVQCLYEKTAFQYYSQRMKEISCRNWAWLIQSSVNGSPSYVSIVLSLQALKIYTRRLFKFRQ